MNLGEILRTFLFNVFIITVIFEVMKEYRENSREEISLPEVLIPLPNSYSIKLFI